MGTALARRTWRRAELAARLRRQAAALIPYLGSRPRWLLMTGWAIVCGVVAGALGAWLVIAFLVARYYGGGLIH